jgi:hypothetical protein
MDAPTNWITASKAFYDAFKSGFPEIEKLEPDYSNVEPFNPELVIQLKTMATKGRSIHVQDSYIVKDWDKDLGILPNRKVMGHYYIDFGNRPELLVRSPMQMYCSTHEKILTAEEDAIFGQINSPIIKVNCDCKVFTSNDDKVYGAIPVYQGYNNGQESIYTEDDLMRNVIWYSDGHNKKYSFELGSSSFESDIKQTMSHAESPLFEVTSTVKFEVDNYLNLYHPESGLYILISKAIFPTFPFLVRPYIFEATKWHCDRDRLQFKLDKSWYSSMDNIKILMSSMWRLIPHDYYAVWKFYNKFRNMTLYKSALEPNNPKPDPDNPASTETETGDTRDKLIRELELRLATCLKQIEKTDSYNRELASLYKTQSAELIDLHRRMNQINADKQTDSTVKKLEESAQVFALKGQLADAQAYIARVQIQGEELTKLEAELSTCKLDVAKYKDLNKGLTDQLLSAKRDLKTKADEHAQGILNINREAVRYSNLEKENAKLKAESITQQAKIKELDTRLLTTAETKPNKEPLETVLSTRCEELSAERNTLAEKYAQLQREHDTNIKAFDVFKANISRLMTGNK